MSDETIVAIYDTPAHAELAADDLRQAGVPESAISIQAGAYAASTGMTSTGATSTGATMPAPREEGFWSSLFGGAPDHDTSVYDRSVDGGASVLTVKTPEGHVSRVLQILESHNPIDIDDRATTLGIGQTTGATSAAMIPNQTVTSEPGKIQLAKENLTIGKRVVNRGGTRVRRFVVEQPVQEDVSLRTEKVVLERHPVTDGRAATDSFSEKAIEMTEMSEEAVVGKTAHVYEEVGLRKEASDRVETVRDTVRKEEVEIEQIPASETVVKTGVKTGSPVPSTPKV